MTSTRDESRRKVLRVALMIVPAVAFFAAPLTSPLYWPMRQARVDRFCDAFPVGRETTDQHIGDAAEEYEVRLSFDRRHPPSVVVWGSVDVWLKIRRICKLHVDRGVVAGKVVWTTND